MLARTSGPHGRVRGSVRSLPGMRTCVCPFACARARAVLPQSMRLSWLKRMANNRKVRGSSPRGTRTDRLPALLCGNCTILYSKNHQSLRLPRSPHQNKQNHHSDKTTGPNHQPSVCSMRKPHKETESSGESRVQVCSRAWASTLVLHFIRKHATRDALHGRVTAAPERNTCSIEPCWRNFRDIDLKAWSPCEKVTRQPGIEPGSH